MADISACVSGLYAGDRGSDVSDRSVFWLVPDHFAEDEPEQPGKNFYWFDLYLYRACLVPYRSKCRLYAGRNRAWSDVGFFAVPLVYCTDRYGDRLFYRYGRAGCACPDPSGRGDDIGCDSGKGNEHKPFRRCGDLTWAGDGACSHRDLDPVVPRTGLCSGDCDVLFRAENVYGDRI